jgi:polar amino acid transport system substrate-binding protein
MNFQSRRTATVRAGVVLVASSLTFAACGTASVATKASGVKVNGVKVSVIHSAAKLLPASYKQSGIKIVTSAPYPPFEEFATGNVLSGLDIDTGKALAAALGTTAHFSSIDFSGVIPSLQAHKYDALLADTGDTHQRSAALDFVEYSLQGEVLVVAKGNPNHITGLKSLCGLTLSMEAANAPSGYFNTVNNYCKSKGKQPMILKQLPTTADALLALTSGTAQAQFVGVGAAPALVAQTKSKTQAINPPGFVGGYGALYVGVGLPKSSPLRAAIVAAMRGLLANGVLKALFTKYGLRSTLISQIKVNAISSGGGSYVTLEK